MDVLTGDFRVELVGSVIRFNETFYCFSPRQEFFFLLFCFCKCLIVTIDLYVYGRKTRSEILERPKRVYLFQLNGEREISVCFPCFSDTAESNDFDFCTLYADSAT